MRKSKLGTRYNVSRIVRYSQRYKGGKPTLSDMDNMILTLNSKTAFDYFKSSVGLDKFIKP